MFLDMRYEKCIFDLFMESKKPSVCSSLVAMYVCCWVTWIASNDLKEGSDSYVNSNALGLGVCFVFVYFCTSNPKKVIHTIYGLIKNAIKVHMVCIFVFCICILVYVSNLNILQSAFRAWREAYFNFRDKNENFFLLTSCFETRMRILFIQSWASRRDREYLSFNLLILDENKDIFLSISYFETRMRIRKLFVKVEREKIELILTWIFENQNSGHFLSPVWRFWLWDQCRCEGWGTWLYGNGGQGYLEKVKSK